MSDLISRQAAIDWASKIPIHDLSDGRGFCRVIFADDFLKALKTIPLAQSQWIPCNERLPEEDFWSGKERQFSNNVLVTIVNHACDDEQVIDIAQTVDGIWKISHDVEGYYRLPSWCEVIAWMPLPPSYKGDKT